jgi:hypothetical protein
MNMKIVIPDRVNILEGCLLMVNYNYVSYLMPLRVDSLSFGSLAEYVH